MLGSRHHKRRDAPQPPDRLLRFVEPPEVRVASREKAIGGCPARMLLQRPKQHRSCFLKPPGEEMSDANRHKGPGSASVRAEPQGSLEMADREFRLPCPQSEPAAYHPAAGEAGVKRQSTVNQFDGRIDVLSKVTEYVGSPAQDTRVVARNPKRPSGEIDTLAAVRLGVAGPAVHVEIHMAVCRHRESGSVLRVALDRPPKQVKCTGGSLPLPVVKK